MGKGSSNSLMVKEFFFQGDESVVMVTQLCE